MVVLRGLCLGNIEDEAHFARVGRKTFDAMSARGWIERAYDETYGVDGWKITPAGELAFQAGYDTGR